MFFSFVVFALLIFRSCAAPPATLRLAAALVVFWPSSIINSVRVHNDALASPLMLTAILVPEDLFFNRLAKSSLFGVISLGDSFADAHHQLLARWLSGGLLAMLAVCLVALPGVRRELFRKYRVCLTSAIVMFIFLFVPFCLGYAAVVRRASRHSQIMHSIGVAGALLMIGLSVAFFARTPP